MVLRQQSSTKEYYISCVPYFLGICFYAHLVGEGVEYQKPLVGEIFINNNN